MSAKKILFSAFLIVLLPNTIAAQYGDSRPSISVNGEAIVNVSPDKCIINLGVEVNEKDVETAQRSITAKAQSLTESLRKFGVPEKGIQTDIVMIKPHWNDEWKTGKVGSPKYASARQSFTITYSEIERVEGLLTEAFKSGATTVHSLDFQISELRKYRDQARQMAVRAAKEKAELVATELGLTGLTPHSIRELDSSVESWYGWGWRNHGRESAISQNSRTHVFSDGQSGGSSIPPRQISVKSAVSIVFLHTSENN